MTPEKTPVNFDGGFLQQWARYSSAKRVNYCLILFFFDQTFPIGGDQHFQIFYLRHDCFTCVGTVTLRTDATCC